MSPMRQVPFRPGFDQSVEAAPSLVEAELEALLKQNAGVTGRSLSDHVMLTVDASQRHFWSPYLHLQVEPHRDVADSEHPERSYVRGFFTPHPNLWTAFVLGGLGNATLIFFSLLWGVVQLQLGRPPVAFWITLASLVVGACVLACSIRGKRLASEQIEELHGLVDQALQRASRTQPG